jgi:hypothetical protein
LETPATSFRRDDRPIEHQNEVVDIGALTFWYRLGSTVSCKLKQAHYRDWALAAVPDYALASSLVTADIYSRNVAS